MGSCISPIIASIYMEHIELTGITTFHTTPSLWLRYVDDTFCIFNKDHINDFYTHLNSICLRIQLNIQKEHNFSLTFLTFWLNTIIIVVMVALPRTAFLPPQFTDNPRTQKDVLITRHITPIIRSTLLPKLYSAVLTLTSQIKHKSTVNYAVLCD